MAARWFVLVGAIATYSSCGPFKISCACRFSDTIARASRSPTTPRLIFPWITAIPCYAALFFGWRIACNIGQDKSFSLENARLLQVIAWLVAGVTLYYFIGNVVFLFLNMNHPGIILIALLICAVGVSITIAAVCLSHLVKKAADLQEQSDLTV